MLKYKTVGIDLGGDAANCGDGGQEFSHIRSFSFFHERGPNGELLARHVHGPSVDDLVLSELSGSLYYYHQDHLNSTIAVTDADGSLVEQYRYDVYGQPSFYGPDGAPRGESAIGLRFLFTAREWLRSLALYDYRHRLYSPSLGRFLQMDPLGFAAGDVSVYGYCNNSALLLIDPYGLFCGEKKTKTFSLLGGRIAAAIGVLADISLVWDTEGNVGVKLTAGIGTGVEVGINPLKGVVNTIKQTLTSKGSLFGWTEGSIFDQSRFGSEGHVGFIGGISFNPSASGNNVITGVEVGSVGGGVYKTGSIVIRIWKKKDCP